MHPVLATRIIRFPPMELVTLPRPGQGTFLCAGAVPILDDAANLTAQTERVGAGLRERVGYRGGFSVDGILTASGFLPTDFNARLTSAMEASPPEHRVLLHAVNLLARDGIEPETSTVEQLVEETFAIGATCTIFGAATHADEKSPREAAVRWSGGTLVLAPSSAADGSLISTPSPRGWLLTATLITGRLPSGGRLGPWAPEVFRLSDEVLGTNFGNLAPPFDTRPTLCLPGARLSSVSTPPTPDPPRAGSRISGAIRERIDRRPD